MTAAEQMQIDREQAHDVLADACDTLGVSWEYIEVQAHIYARTDCRHHSTDSNSMAVAMEALLPDGHGRRSFQVVTRSAPQLSQAVAQIVAHLRHVIEMEVQNGG